MTGIIRPRYTAEKYFILRERSLLLLNESDLLPVTYGFLTNSIFFFSFFFLWLAFECFCMKMIFLWKHSLQGSANHSLQTSVPRKHTFPAVAKSVKCVGKHDGGGGTDI